MGRWQWDPHDGEMEVFRGIVMPTKMPVAQPGPALIILTSLWGGYSPSLLSSPLAMASTSRMWHTSCPLPPSPADLAWARHHLALLLLLLDLLPQQEEHLLHHARPALHNLPDHIFWDGEVQLTQNFPKRGAK